MSWLGQLFSRRHHYDELSESIREHLDEKIEDMIDHGMTREEAERKARREFGNVTLIEQRSREVWQWPTLESLWADTKYVMRRLRRAPLFTAIALITLAVAVGANTVIFSVVNGVLLKPLSYPNPDRLIAVDHLSQQAGFKKMGISPSIYFVYREQNTTLADIGAYDGDELDVTGAGTPEHVRVLDVTDGTLPLMGVSPVLGRLFTRQDDAPGAAQTVVLTYPYWQQRFGGASSVIGSSITVGGVPREIIGVLPRRFHFLDQKDSSLILPMQWDRATTALGSFNANAIARLKPGVSVQQATADLERLLPVVARTFPPPEGLSANFFQSMHLKPRLKPLKDEVVGNVQSVLWVLLASTILVLLVACANVANLLVVRVEGRHHEFAIRYAIGGTRKGISADILFESSLLGLAGSLIGLLLALGAMRVIVGLGATNIPRIRDIGITPSVLLFTVAIAVIASLLIGCVPILKSTSSHLMSDLRDGGRGVGDGRRGQGTRKALVMLQVALSVVLLICSGLMIRTFRAMMHVSPGFTSPESVQTFGFYIPETQIPDTSPELVVRMDEAITQKIASIPGVSSVSIGSAVPMDKNSYNNPVFVQNRTYEGSEIPPSRRFNFVTPGFFSTLGTQLLAGRDFIWTDIYEKRPVVIISKSFASDYWHRPQDALGQRIRVGSTDTWREIIGVSEDVHYDGVEKPTPSMVYWPLMMDHFTGQKQRLQRSTVFVVRSQLAGTQSLMKAIQQQVSMVNPNVPLANSDTLGNLYTQSMARTSFTLVMLCVSGGIALLLGTVGIYGVMAYSVSQRTREIGIRMALGAPRGAVVGAFVRQGMWLTVVGIAIGLVVASATMRFMSSLLYGVSAEDPITYITITCAVVIAALLACYLPSRRAAAVDPMLALRSE
ncbi:MAG: putative transport system permease protein [Acidobacteriaceae bacterium]|nr:putative transport system permease protein [Acidobacteriaceae bacterium]